MFKNVYRNLLSALMVAIASPALAQGDNAAALTLDEEWAKLAETYPGFAGHYRGDDGKVTVKMAGAGNAARARPFLDMAFGSDHRVEPAEYDFKTLFDWKTAALELLVQKEVPVVFIDADERRNRIVVGIDTQGDRGMLAKAEGLLARSRGLARAGVPREAIILESAEPLYQTALRDRQRPVSGGFQVTVDIGTSSGACSLGTNAKRDGVVGFLTAAHCALRVSPVNGRGVFQPTIASTNQLGTVSAVGPFVTSGCPAGATCKFGDVMFVTHTSAANATLGAIAISSYNGTGGVNPPYLAVRTIRAIDSNVTGGQAMRHTGRTTGTGVGGAVNRTCFTITGNLDGITYLCENSYPTSQPTLGGDSGGSVYYQNSDGTLNFSGVVWGGNSTTTIYTPWSTILRQLGNVTIY
jgi:hypothetical protein